MDVKKIPINGDPPQEFQVIDKRHFSGTEGIPAGSPGEERSRYPSFVEELMGKVSEMEKRFAQKKVEMQGELDRTRARLQADFERQVELEKHKLLLPFLEVLDNLDRALDSPAGGGNCDRLREGVEMTRSLFRAKLVAQGVEVIPVLDQPFDPNVSEAVGTVPVADEASDGVVMEEVKSGYSLGDRLVRPAQVRVGRYAPAPPE